MPINRDHLAMSYNLAKFYDAAITTQIFQSNTTETKGVCRAIASTWIQSHLTGTYGEWRRMVDTFVTLKMHPELEKLQAEQVDKFHKLTKLDDINKEMKRIADKFFIREKRRKEKLGGLLKELTSEIDRRENLVWTNGQCDTADLLSKEALATEFATEAEHAGEGYYFVNLPEHAVAFYYSEETCRFIDANSCEFVFSSGFDFSSFFEEYLEKMFGRHYVEQLGILDKPSKLKGFSGPPPQDPGWKSEPSEWACPFESCFKNRFGGGCYHKALPLAVAYMPLRKRLLRARERLRKKAE
jgi:hypothetical protein